METFETILVWKYRYWDEKSAGWKVSQVYATNEAIRNGLGSAIHETGMTVLRSDLEGGAIFIPDEEAADS